MSRAPRAGSLENITWEVVSKQEELQRATISPKHLLGNKVHPVLHLSKSTNIQGKLVGVWGLPGRRRRRQGDGAAQREGHREREAQRGEEKGDRTGAVWAILEGFTEEERFLQVGSSH